MISIIAAIASNNIIGKDNKLLWHIPEDLKRFKNLTKDHVIIMGQKTYESLPIKPLPDRTNIVISNNINFKASDDVIIVYSIGDAISESKKYDKFSEIFIIGGGSIYGQFMPLADKLYITEIHKNFEGDVFFPKIDYNIWDVKNYTKSQTPEFGISYITYEKNLSGI